MSAKEPEDPDQAGDLDAELQRTISEAEAAVDAVRQRAEEEEEEQASEVVPLEKGGAEPGREDAAAALAAARRESEELRDKWLRSVADHDNYRKRVKRDIDDAVGRATASLLESFLPTVDNLERAMAAAAGADSSLVEGLRMVLRDFLAALARHGIAPIESVGQPFDPSRHDALQQIDSPEHAPGVVIREFEKGYLRGDRLLRPARVVIAGPGSTGDPGEPGPGSSAAED
jgi:molecular chaperone GrpE